MSKDMRGNREFLRVLLNRQRTSPLSPIRRDVTFVFVVPMDERRESIEKKDPPQTSQEKEMILQKKVKKKCDNE
jgi:hypothetical protein